MQLSAWHQNSRQVSGASDIAAVTQRLPFGKLQLSPRSRRTNGLELRRKALFQRLSREELGGEAFPEHQAILRIDFVGHDDVNYREWWRQRQAVFTKQRSVSLFDTNYSQK